jgi:excisionase family DNA binding protein
VQQTATNPIVIDTHEVAALLGTSRIFVIRASRAGKIPALKIGKCYRYRPESIQTWLREQELLNAIEQPTSVQTVASSEIPRT